MKPILEIQGVGKKYQIASNNGTYLSLRENLFSFLSSSKRKEQFWALRDITFNVEPGDTVGIIGKNGAGKSTLLKILSKITPPTEGRILSRGRIASLLEVGTGFHSELSGKENIYMNGSILGLRKQEIRNNFDAIVDFAGVEKFLNTPLKHYSSGMQLRLAFAVAAFLQNEVLIIDEVLAVGDSEFQKKCMGKMKAVSGDGRTVLFVSHNIGAIQALCKRSVLLEKGQLKDIGSTGEVISAYLKSQRLQHSWEFEFNQVNEFAFITKLQILDLDNEGITELPIGKPWKVVITFTVVKSLDNLVVGLGMVNGLEVPIRNSWNNTVHIQPGEYKATFVEKQILLAAGHYRFIAGLSIGKQSLQYIDQNIDFNISNIVESQDQNVLDNSNAVFINQMEMSLEKS